MNAVFPSGKPVEAALDKLVDQYRLAVEMWDRVRARRQQSNQFYVSINTAFLTAIVALMGVGHMGNDYLIIVLSMVGLALCVLWFFTIMNYKLLTENKLEIIGQLEQVLPACPFSVEKRSHSPFTVVERGVSIVFFILYVAVLVIHRNFP
jgi:hypothetical protein